MEEEWKIIKNYDNYECSNMGRIRNGYTKRILNPKINGSGYITINLTNNENVSLHSGVHRFIAETWLDNQENKPTVNHKNGIRSDNNINNLEWATYIEQYADKKTRSKSNIKNNNRGIWQYDIKSKEKIKYFKTIKDAAIYINKPDGWKNISYCARGKSNYAYGYIWKYNDTESLTGEQWKLYTAYKNNKYFISNYGRLKNNDRISKISKHHSGYCMITINKKCYQLHRMVAEKFIDNPNNYDKVNHINGDKSDNKYSNLEWCTNSHNINHAIDTGLKKVHKIINYDINYKILNIYRSCPHASKELNVHESSINKCCKGLIKSCGNGLLFKYQTETDDIINMIIDHKTLPQKKQKVVREKKYCKINVYDKKGNLIDTCNNKTETSKKYNVSYKTILQHCNDSIKYSPLKYTFKYA